MSRVGEAHPKDADAPLTLDRSPGRWRSRVKPTREPQFIFPDPDGLVEQADRPWQLSDQNVLRYSATSADPEPDMSLQRDHG